jgi:hypothetical protein
MLHADVALAPILLVALAAAALAEENDPAAAADLGVRTRAGSSRASWPTS